MAWPEAPWSVIRWRLATVQADRPDATTGPAWMPAVGARVRLRPSITGVLTYTDPSDVRLSLHLGEVSGVIDADGWLVDPQYAPTGLRAGVAPPLAICSTDDPGLSVTGWTWTAHIEGTSTPIAVRFAAASGQIVDLSDYVQVPAIDANRSWIEQVPELIAQAAAVRAALEDAEEIMGLTGEDEVIALLLQTDSLTSAEVAAQIAAAATTTDIDYRTVI